MDISTVYDIPLADIDLQGVNVRTDLGTDDAKEALNELAESINEFGLMQPIVLKGVFGSPPYDVVVGQRRFLAHQLLGKTTITASFTGDIDEMQALMISLSENLHRYDLSYRDTEKAITTLYRHYNKDVQLVAKAIGFSVRKVRSYIKISEQATDKIKTLLDNHEILPVDARRAIDSAQGDPEKADMLIDRIKDLTKYEKKRIVEYGQKNPDANVEEIIIGAEKDRIEETVILNLPYKVGKALAAAAKDLEIDPDVLTMNALTEWLKTNAYLNE